MSDASQRVLAALTSITRGAEWQAPDDDEAVLSKKGYTLFVPTGAVSGAEDLNQRIEKLTGIASAFLTKADGYLLLLPTEIAENPAVLAALEKLVVEERNKKFAIPLPDFVEKLKQENEDKGPSSGRKA